MKKYDVIIVGGGPAGIFAALELTTATREILILEKREEIGKTPLPVEGTGVPLVWVVNPVPW